MLDIKRVLASKPRKPEHVELTTLLTPWGEKVAAGEKDASLASHPRPQLVRDAWTSLDGIWECAFVFAPDAASAWRASTPPAGGWQAIRVPFSPEAPLSGVGRQLQPSELLWYRRTFDVPELGADERLILHFEAVDWACSVFVNGVPVCEHVGGYLPFSADVTEALRPGTNHLMLCVFDPSDAGTQLRGKQRLERGGIWYTAQSGIWQDVWCEIVPAAHVSSLVVDARMGVDGGELVLLAGVEGEGTLIARLLDEGREVARASVRTAGAREARLRLKVAEPHLWRPSDPHLYDIELMFGADRARSYCGFRSVEVSADRGLFINGESVKLKGVCVHQDISCFGTAVTKELWRERLLSLKEIGCNAIRLAHHLYLPEMLELCDELGFYVYEEAFDKWTGGAYGRFYETEWEKDLDFAVSKMTAILDRLA